MSWKRDKYFFTCPLSAAVDLRITTWAILSFAVVFLRINEPLKLRRSDIIFYPSHCSISIRNSKTDVYRLVTV